MHPSNCGVFCRSRTNVRRSRARPVLEELEARITPSTGPELHVANVLTSQIASPNPGLDADTTVTIDAAGRVATFWEDSASDATPPSLHGEVNGSPTFTVSTAGLIISAASDTAGDVAVVWESLADGGGPTSGYYVSFFSAGGAALGVPVHLGNSAGLIVPTQAKVAGDNTGLFMVVWQESDRSTTTHAQVFTAAGQALAPAFLVSSGTNPTSDPTVAADVGGGFVALWQVDLPLGGPPAGIFGQHYDATGTAQGPTFLVNATGGQWVQVASDGAGNLAAVWSVYSGIQSPVLSAIDGQRFTDLGVLQGGVFAVDITPVAGTTSPTLPALAMDGAGNFEVVYGSENTYFQGNTIYGQRFGPTGSPIGTLARLSPAGVVGGPSYGAVQSWPPTLREATMAADAGGDFVVGWTATGNATALLFTGSTTNRPPQNLNQVAPADESASVRVSYYESQSYFVDPDNDLLNFTATLANGSALPAWLHLDGNGLLWGTPDSAAAGQTYQVKVTASDAYGGSASLVLPLTVRPDPTLPDGTEFVVSPSATTPATFLVSPSAMTPATAVNAAGTTLVVWLDPSTPLPALMGRVYDARHMPVGVSFVISPPGSQNPSAEDGYTRAASVTADAAGNFDVVWHDGIIGPGTSQAELFFRRYSPTGVALGEAVPLAATHLDAFNGDPRVAADTTGNLVLTWTSSRASEFGPITAHVYAMRLSPQGSPLSAPVQVGATGDQSDVAVSPGGRTLVVWHATDQVMTQLFDARLNPLAAPVPVGRLGSQEQAQPTVAADGLGNFDIAWASTSVDRLGQDIVVERFDDRGRPLENSVGNGQSQASAFPRGNQDAPRIAADSRGSFTVVWQGDQQDGDGLGIFGRRFGPSGLAVDGEFRINTTTAGDQAVPALVAAASGEFLAVWQSTRPGATSAGLMGQWYQPIPSVQLPNGWNDVDVNGAYPAGSASYGNGVWTVTGGGSGIRGTADRFNFASQPVTGNTTITAELTSFNGSNYSAFAGVMLRNSMAPGDLFVDMGYTPQWGAWMQWRSSANGSASNTNVFKVPAPSSTHPLWLKLVQNSTTCTGYESADGVTWTMVGSTSVALHANASAGLAVTSEYSAPLVTATFSNVIVGLPNGWIDVDVNRAYPAGSAGYGSGVWTVTGGGSGIGGTADRFNFASQSATGNSTIIAELTSFNGSNYSAFAGVMLRNSTAPGDLFVDMGYTPQWGAWMEWRSSVDGSASNTNVFKVPPPSSTHPLWLKLVRNSNTCTGYESADGMTWTMVGRTAVALNVNALMGLAVTSEYSAPLVTATFTNVSVGPSVR